MADVLFFSGKRALESGVPRSELGVIFALPPPVPRRSPKKEAVYRTSKTLRWQILRDHKYVEDVQLLLTGERQLIEPVSSAVFMHHHRYAVNERAQRQAWRERGYMQSSDEGTYCHGCRWRVTDRLTPRLLAIVPSVTREQAEAFLAKGQQILARRGKFATRR